MNAERRTQNEELGSASAPRTSSSSAFFILRSAFFLRLFWPTIAILFALAIWTALTHFTHATIFPTPLAVVKGLVQLAEQSLLWAYIGDSLLRVGVGYAIAVLLGIPVGLILGSSAPLATAINPVLQMMRPISPLAWMPLAVIWFGVSNVAPIFLIFLASFFPVVLATMNGVRNVPPVFIQAGRNFGLTPLQLLVRVVFPAVLPRILIGLRIAFGIAWLVLVAAEMIAVDSGLGYLIIDARNAGKRYDLVIGGMLLIGLIGLALDSLLRLTEKFRFVRWAFRE